MGAKKTVNGELRKMLNTKKWRSASIAKLGAELERRGAPPNSYAYLRRARQRLNTNEFGGELPDLRKAM